ncbi:MAG: hypothetical protein B7X43_01420 [Thiomonas sp. 15-63-373]|nr:MAG: hypothetical protein B7X43_01420 [Thiomonas sp. 15-63-373]
MNAAAEIRRNLRQIAISLKLPTAPDFLTGEQIAQVAKLKDAHTLSSSVERGVRTGDKRWIAYRTVIRKGAHRVPAADVAHWMAIAAGRLPMPPSAAAAAPAGAVHALESAWSGLRRVVRCEG